MALQAQSKGLQQKIETFLSDHSTHGDDGVLFSPRRPIHVA
jgi:hypothetical protein